MFNKNEDLLFSCVRLSWMCEMFWFAEQLLLFLPRPTSPNASWASDWRSCSRTEWWFGIRLEFLALVEEVVFGDKGDGVILKFNAFEIEVEEVAIDGVCVDEDWNVSSSFKIEFRTSASHPDLSSASRFFFYFRSNLLICQVLEMTFCRSSSRWRDVLVRWSLFSKFTLVIPAPNWLRCTNRPLGIYPIRPSMPIPPRIPGPYPT